MLRLLTVLATVAALATPLPAEATRHNVLATYAADTWRSMAALVDPATALPADNIDGALDPASRSRYTSPTNVGMYLWATVSARHLGLIRTGEAKDRIRRTLTTLRTLARHPASGQFYNWYDPATGAVLRTWPVDGSTVHPFLSSVDNGWLASGLLTVAGDLPDLAGPAWSVLSGMDFGFYYDPAARGADVPAGLIRGGFWDEQPPGCSVLDNYRDRGPEVWYTCHHYGAFNTEPRIASYIGIALGQIPAAHYFAGWRTFPPTCDWSWQEQQPVGHDATYLGVPVFEGTYAYRGMRLVPTWGGSMFEALMVPLVVPEETWGPRSWGRNHPRYVKAQIEHGLTEARYGYWGFSPSNNPDGTPPYREWGVDAIGMDGPGYTSDVQRTSVDDGFGDCPDRPAVPPPASFGDGVVTPHASFLALRYAPHAALSNLDKLRRDFGAYGPGGFYDAVNVGTGAVSRTYLALDQGMVLAAATNALRGDVLRRAFTNGPIARLRPLIAMEDWRDVQGG
ncbi:glucoamylase family protein [Actinophytocola sp.]|uniref:glucoamylase family protein n=1 Tax=Actinophytocola sp. TaxID=1872138 RepID=UPI002D7EA5CE|nr:glucoamylase family protein [Actinophytocola sp.]HET9142834.1 glucoamylase family protein [Actinophytocola sp.]